MTDFTKATSTALLIATGIRQIADEARSSRTRCAAEKIASEMSTLIDLIAKLNVSAADSVDDDHEKRGGN
ncbi:MAG: hypothetical protein AAF456_14515 [Planctomycetota bacterium]